MKHSKKFIELLIRFSECLAELTDQPLDDVLADHTVFRQLLGLPYGDELHGEPLWQEFVSGVTLQQDKVDWAYRFHLAHTPTRSEPEQPVFGCFTYDYYFRPVVKLHFRNVTYGRVLVPEAIETRKAEIGRLFNYVKEHHPDADGVRGSSWLYNIEAYRRLFPPDYVASARPVGYETGYYSLWGQFLHADRSIREGIADQFLACLAKQTTVDGCESCFPFEVLQPECSIEAFYNFYAV